MAGPFYNNIRGTTAGAPGTGAFTPNAAAAGSSAWATVASGYIGLIRYEDGSAWELRFGYWNGTTISRPANGFHSSSTGSGLSLSSSATAELVSDGSEVQPHVAGVPYREAVAVPNSTSSAGRLGVAVSGTGAAAALAATNYLTEQPRIQYSSATTANAQAGWSVVSTPQAIYSTTAGRGGFEFVARFGASQLPTGPRLMVGVVSSTFVGNTGEPSAFTAHVAAFAKDSTDTNIQFLTNSNAGAGTKIDTGIPLVANGWYEASVWADPGGGRIYGLLIRLDTGEIWYGSTTTDIPAATTLLLMLIGGLSATTGTAFIMHPGSLSIRNGSG
jgi:hypothetical protein